ncbi:MAG: leucine-rich repeat protein [Oscillospiraceae bacterium]|nr:leucine-rich repeat protein [Oscillospiraceae bacterium]
MQHRNIAALVTAVLLTAALTPQLPAGAQQRTYKEKGDLIWRYDPETDLLLITGSGALSEAMYPDCPGHVIVGPQVTEIGQAFSGQRNLAHLTILNPSCEISYDQSTISNEYEYVFMSLPYPQEGYYEEHGYFGGVLCAPEGGTLESYANWFGYRFEACPEAGDIDGDGGTGLTDLVLLQKYLVGKTAFTPLQEVLADANFDAYTNVIDLALLRSQLLQSSAPEILRSGTCGEDVEWTLDTEGTLTIRGTGAMKDFIDNGSYRAPWYQDRAGIKRVHVYRGVSSIGNYAFDGCSALEQISLPDTVTTIGKFAFRGCTALPGLTLPDSVAKIGDGVFYGCTGLTDITLPESVTYLGSSAFSGCTELKSAALPDSMQWLENSTFEDCSGLTSLQLPAALTSIGNGCFKGCISLSEMEIPAGVKSIGTNAFKDSLWLALQQMKDPYVVVNGILVDVSACSGDLVIPDSVTSFPASMFYGNTRITSVTVPGSVTDISYNAFKNCTKLTGVTLEEGVTSLGAGSFEGCTALRNVVLPDSLQKIGYQAFMYAGVQEITVPAGVQSVGDDAFRECTQLSRITILNPDCVIEGENTTICNSYYEEQQTECDGVWTDESGNITDYSVLIRVIPHTQFTGEICGRAGSNAQTYASNCGYTFTPLD